MTDVTSSCLHCHIADNVVVVSGPDASLDFDHSIEEVSTPNNYAIVCLSLYYGCVDFILPLF